MAIGPARMPLMEHLGELRMRLVRIVVVLIVGCCIFYLAAGTVGQFLLLPIAEFLPQGDNGTVDLQFINALDPFTVKFKIAFWMSVVATSPIILWQVLAFFLPALKPSERKWFIPTFAAAVALFIIGTVFCYLIILHPAFQWLTSQVAGLGTVLPNAANYIDVIIKFEIGFGIAFEIPIVIFYLVIFQIVPYKKLRSSWRFVYVGLMVFSAMVTPDANPITMLLMFAALLGLYELSLLIARIVLAKRIKKQQEEGTYLGDDDEDEGDKALEKGGFPKKDAKG
ncbi:MAG: twin-arginine translocase subunit TatC [Eggerthellaceae bacterium]|nr:twin-arginine translocase subunit TatC [Eggerthellaceae bacterium]